MRNRLAARAGAWVVGSFLLAGQGALAQQHAHLVPQLGSSEIDSVAFSPDGRFILTGGKDETAHLWDEATGREIRTFEAHNDPVTYVAFAPDGRYALTGSGFTTARLWDVATGKQIRSFKIEGQVADTLVVALSPDGRLVLTGNPVMTVLWDVATGRKIRSIGPAGEKSWTKSMAFSPDGSTFFVVHENGVVDYWETASGRLIRSIDNSAQYRGDRQKSGISPIAFTPDGSYLVAEFLAGRTGVWDVGSGKLLSSVDFDRDRYSGIVKRQVVSSDGHIAWIRVQDGILRISDAATGRQVRSTEGYKSFLNDVAFSSNGRDVFCEGKLWDLASGREIRSFMGVDTPAVDSVAFFRDGLSILTARENGEAQLWDAVSGQQFHSLKGAASVAVFPDGRFVLTGGSDGTARLWDAASGEQIRTFTFTMDKENGVAAIAISPDGRSIFTGMSNGTMQLWDVNSGQQLRSFGNPSPKLGSDTSVDGIAFSPNGRYVLTGNEENVGRLWDLASGKQVRAFKGHYDQIPPSTINSVAYSPDGRYVLIGSGSLEAEVDKAQLWSAGSGLPIRSFYPLQIPPIDVGTSPVISVAFSPDGRFVFAGGGDEKAHQWDTATGRRIHSFEGHLGPVNALAVSPDGRLLLTGGEDGTARVWDVASGKQLATLATFGEGNWVVTDPEGRFDTNDLDGGAPLDWVVDDDPMRAMPLEIFMRDYYTPRLLSLILNHEELPPIRSIAEIKNRVQPDVAVNSVTASMTLSGRVDVVVHAASHKDEKGTISGLQDLRLFRNGQLVANTLLDHPLDDGDFTFKDIQLPTSAKTVTFTAYAFNSDRIKSSTAKMEYAYDPGPTAKPHAYLLQIGVNHYQASGCELNGSATDAEQLNKLLTERLAARALDVKPVLLVSTATENDATKEKIRDALKAIAAVATPDDVFFLSFSGHGYGNKDGQFYILPSDIQGSCEGVDSDMLKGAISADELAEWLRPIDAGEMTFILDSCDSASSVEANNFKPGPMGSRGLGQLAYDKRMRILVASQSNQAARESDSLHQGLLSYALTQSGLVEGRADWKPKDQKITVGEWLSYAADEVPKIRENGGIETPKGLIPVGEPLPKLKSGQIPAVFDFSKTDSFILQQVGPSALP